MLTFEPASRPPPADPRARDPNEPLRVIRRLLGWPALPDLELPRDDRRQGLEPVD